MKTVVITGSTRGLGYELAKQFRSHDFNIVIRGTKEETVQKAIEKLNQINGSGKVCGLKCNVSVLSEVEALAAFAKENCGQIDIWINNAGVNQSYRYAWEIEEKELDLLLGVDLKGTINGSNTAMKVMIKQGFGAVYNVEGMGSNDALANEIKEKKLPIIVGKLSPGIMITDFLTSAGGQQGSTQLTDKTKKVYNILGDYPDVIAEYLAAKILLNQKNGIRISWLTNKKAALRFMGSKWNKRDFFSEKHG